MKCIGDGPIPARIMIVAEAPGAEEEKAGKPFVGQSGQELTRMLHEAGIIRAECFITNVIRWRPANNEIEQFIPERKGDITSDCVALHDKMVKPVVYEGYQELLREIQIVQPNVIVACGNVSLWALTGKWGITSWRGSLLESSKIGDRTFKVIPTYHPAAILRQWDWRVVAVHDLKRVKKESETPELKKPVYNFQVRPTYEEVMRTLDGLYQECEHGILDLAVDIETRRGHIACLGVAWSSQTALCIPFMCIEKRDGYWLEEQEAEIVYTLQRLLTHKNCHVIGQNFLYDTQYIWRHWKFILNVQWDTMTAHHVMFLALPKGLHFLSSLYCENHVYWKDEGKEWDPSISEEQLWRYNCQDAVRTWEIKQSEARSIEQMGLREQHDFQRILWWACLESMIRGMKINHTARPELAVEFSKKMTEIEEFFRYVLGHDLNPRSTHPNGQMRKLFYDDLKMPIQINRKTKQPTLDDAALDKIASKEPLLRPLISAIGDYRSLGVFKSTFVEAKLDNDGRMRCTLDPNGTDTLRLSSYENAFGTGMNMQNLPSDKSKSIGKAAKRVRVQGMELKLPNIRQLFLPDDGKTIFDADLDRADLQVVVWECNDQMLKQALRDGVDIHLLNACVLSGAEPPPLAELVETHERYPHWRSKYKLLREFAKVFCHGTNYGGGAKTMAANCGITVFEAERAQKIWFGAHPGIKDWHRRIEHELMTTRSVSNKFGYKMHFFDRIEGLLPEALAWIPQSTVACVINRGWVNLTANVPAVQVLIQVHDSLVGQFDTPLAPTIVPQIREMLRIKIPYDDPLIIPVGVKTSERTWGDCK